MTNLQMIFSPQRISSFRRCVTTNAVIAKRILLSLVLLMITTMMNNAHATPLQNGSHWITVNGHAMYYEVHGQGRPLLLLHGGGDSGMHSFERQLHNFERNHQLILPDQVGQGRTPDVSGALSYTAMMQDTLELLKSLKIDKVDVVGFSDGGILGLMLAVRHPERVRRLVISGVNIAPEGLTSNTLEELRAMPISESPSTVDEKLRNLWLSSPTEQELNLELLSKINESVLVISGDRDVVTFEHTVQIYRAIPHAELCVLPNTDHEVFFTRADWLNPIALSFLDRATPAHTSP